MIHSLFSYQIYRLASAIFLVSTGYNLLSNYGQISPFLADFQAYF